jgi:hypothetical protein
MTNPTANPLGAGGDVTIAAQKIGAILRAEPQGQPAPDNSAPPVQEANPQANQADPRAPVKVTMLKDPTTGRFVKAEPETAEEVTPEPEVADDTATEGTETAETTEPASDTEELADSIEGLAKQLGMEPDELSDHLKATIKINGEERRANLKELIAGYQKGEDYSRKTAALAEEKRAFESERSAITEQRERIASQIQPFLQQLESMVVNDEHHLKQLLEEGDLLGYERAKVAAEQRRAAHDTAQREMQRIESERASEARQKLERDVAENEHKLGELRPEWAKDPEKGKKEIASIRQYLKDKGVPSEAADILYDATSIIIAENSMKYEQLLKEKASKLNEAKLAPKKFQRAGPAKPAVDPAKQVHRANLNRLRKTGSVKDAAAAFRSGGFLSG